MDILQETTELPKNTFLGHVFSSSEEGKAEFLNVVQYSLLAVVPVVGLNKSIQRFIPEADTEKSSLELLVEIFIQLVVMFCGIILIHRVITYIPTYSGFKYEHLTLTNVILAFLVIVLSIQSKLGLKVNILVDRLGELWNGSSSANAKLATKGNVRVSAPTTVPMHSPSQADYLDNSATQPGLFPPAPVSGTPANKQTYDTMMRSSGINEDYGSYMGPMAANSVLGGSFGSSF
jgi:hypothetical protein